MAEVSWIKLSVNIFDDEKIKLIKQMPEGKAILLIWIQLLCLAGKTNDGGAVYMGQNIYYTDEMLATICDETVANVRLALDVFSRFGMIYTDKEGLIQISNWEKHQNVAGMERIKTGNAERQQLFYWRKKLQDIGVDPYNDNFTDDVEELKMLYNQKKIEKPNKPNKKPNKPNVSLTLGSREPNGPDKTKEDKNRLDKIRQDNYYESEKNIKESENRDHDEILNRFSSLKGGLANTRDSMLITETLEEFSKEEIVDFINQQIEMGKTVGSFAYIKKSLENRREERKYHRNHGNKQNQRQESEEIELTQDDVRDIWKEYFGEDIDG